MHKRPKKKGQEYPQTMIIPRRWVFIFYFGFLFVARCFIKTLIYFLPISFIPFQEGRRALWAPWLRERLWSQAKIRRCLQTMFPLKLPEKNWSGGHSRGRREPRALEGKEEKTKRSYFPRPERKQGLARSASGAWGHSRNWMGRGNLGSEQVPSLGRSLTHRLPRAKVFVT